MFYKRYFNNFFNLKKEVMPLKSLFKQNGNDGFVAGSSEVLIPSQSIVDSNPTEQISDFFHQKGQEILHRNRDSVSGIDLNDRNELFGVIERINNEVQPINQEASSTQFHGSISNSIQNALELISPIKHQNQSKIDQIVTETLLHKRTNTSSRSSDDSIQPTWRDTDDQVSTPSRSSSTSSSSSIKNVKLKPLLDHKNARDKFYDAAESIDQNESKTSSTNTSISHETTEQNENNQTHVYEMCSSSIIFEPKVNRIQKENLAKRIFSQISNSASKIFIRQNNDTRLNQSTTNLEDNITTSEILATKKTNVVLCQESATSPASKLIDKIIIDKEINGDKTRTPTKNKRKRKLFPIGDLNYIESAFQDASFVESDNDETQAKQKSLMQKEKKQDSIQHQNTPLRSNGDITQKSCDTIMSDKTIPLGQLALLSKNTSVSSVTTASSNSSNDEHTKVNSIFILNFSFLFIFYF
jgi:hypothetical protein